MDIIISAFLFGLAFIALQTEVTPLWLDWPFIGLCVALAIAQRTLAKEKWCRDLRNRLAVGRSAQPYRALMLPLLRRVTRWRRPRVKGRDKGRDEFRARDVAAATRTAYAWFGWTLLDVAFLWAVVYPILLVALQWAVMGEGRLGPFAVMPEWQSWTEPTAVVVASTFILVAPKLIKSAKANPQVFLRKVAGRLAMDGLALASASGVGGAFAGAFAVVLVGVLALASATAFGAKFIGAFAISLSALLAPASASTFGFAVLVAAVAAFLGSVTAALLVGWFLKRGHSTYAYGLLVMALISVNFAASGVLRMHDLSDTRLGIFLFLGLFPIINGVFDFLSYGITLGLWRLGLRRGGIAPWFLGFADIVAALFLFTGLGVALIVSLAVMNRLAGEVFFPLGPIFADLRSPPVPGQPWSDSPQAQYLWLYAMLFSTLVPTLIHAGLSCLSLVQWAPAGLRRRYVGWIDRRDDSPWAEIGVTVVLGLTWFLSFALPLVALGGLFWLVQVMVPLAGETYLQVFELLALWLGQVDKIGPGFIPQGWNGGVDV